jgi:hypothetical protein
MPSDSEKRLKQGREQRSLVYQFLKETLSDGSMTLIAPLHQLSALEGKKIKGYCHGYCKAWEQILAQPNINNTFFAWSELDADKNFDYFIKLDGKVKLMQKNQNKKYKHSTYCRKESLSHILLHYVRQNKYEPETMYVIDFGRMPNWGQLFFKKFPQQIKKWHESRLYIDSHAFFHWFDPNFGWLKSSIANPDLTTFFSKLDKIFSLFNYDKLYRFINIEPVKITPSTSLLDQNPHAQGNLSP